MLLKPLKLFQAVNRCKKRNPLELFPPKLVNSFHLLIQK